MGPISSIAMPWPETIIPTARLLPAISKATTLWTIVDMKKARKERSVPIHSTRNFGILNAAKAAWRVVAMATTIQETAGRSRRRMLEARLGALRALPADD